MDRKHRDESGSYRLTISPDGLLDHPRRLAGQGRGRPPDVDLRRGVSAAYYSVFHDVTDKASRHLIGSAAETERNKLRRSWSHGEISAVAELVVGRAKTLAANPNAPLSADLAKWGPLIDLAAGDANLVSALRLFSELQEKRHRADYAHDARFEKLTLLSACADAKQARDSLGAASTVSREALFSLLTVRLSDFRPR